MSTIEQNISVTAPVDALTVTAVPGSGWAAVESDWAELCKLSPYSSYFLGVDWVGSWIESYCKRLDIEILRFSNGARVVGACLLVWRKQRRGPVRIRRVYLNASGEDEWEEARTEFNDVLCLAGWEESVAASLRRHLDGCGWDEFVMSACRESAAIRAVRQALGDLEQQQDGAANHYVDLEEVRRSGEPFEMSMSPRSRENLRRKTRVYERMGEIRLHRAESAEEANAMLDELIRLHQERWHKKDRLGAFASPRFRQFQHAVLARSFHRGQVDVLRVTAGKELVGLLHNYVVDGKVYFYQSGFNIADKKLSPGTVTLFAAIRHYLAAGLDEFYFMSGDSAYKKSFSPRFCQLDWWTIRRATWRTVLVDVLRVARMRVPGMPQRQEGEGQSEPAEAR
jgi:CelD/BcsL family acetyltransferase involved in cellulose biosynthesis